MLLIDGESHQLLPCSTASPAQEQHGHGAPQQYTFNIYITQSQRHTASADKSCYLRLRLGGFAENGKLAAVQLHMYMFMHTYDTQCVQFVVELARATHMRKVGNCYCYVRVQTCRNWVVMQLFAVLIVCSALAIVSLVQNILQVCNFSPGSLISLYHRDALQCYALQCRSDHVGLVCTSRQMDIAWLRSDWHFHALAHEPYLSALQTISEKFIAHGPPSDEPNKPCGNNPVNLLGLNPINPLMALDSGPS